MKRIILYSALISGLAAEAATEVSDTVQVRQLDEVTVSADGPLIKGKDGIMTVDLPAIVRDKPVSNVLEALGYLPGVTDSNGMIGLAGASGVTIILNGELSDMPVQNMYQLLYNTPVDRLKNVEIMYSAPAGYHADGAVINVVLRNPSPLDGLQGQARGGFNQAHYASSGAGLAATYATGDWIFDLNYGLSRTRSWSCEEAFSNHLLDGRRIPVEDLMRRIGKNWSNTVYASVTRKKLKLTYNAQIISGSQTRSLSSGSLGDFSNLYDYDSPIQYHDIVLRYSAPFGLTAAAQYTRYSESRSQSLFKGSDYLLGAVDRQSVNNYRLYIDQSHQLGKWGLHYGAEFRHSDDHSQQRHISDAQPGFDDTLSEDVGGVYIGTGRSFDWGLSFNASAKGEYFHSRYQHDWNFVPQLSATFCRNPISIFQLNFSSQRVYPSYWELHGGSGYISDYAVVAGNPELQPYMDYSSQFSYIYRQKYSATLYFQYGDRATVQLPYQSPDELRLVYQTINTNYKRVAGVNLYAPFDVGFIWSTALTANIFNQREKADRFHDISFDNSRWVFYGSVSNTFRFSRECPVSLSVDFAYISPSLQGIADLSSLWKINAGIKWKFGRKRCCELDLKADDMFNRWSPVMTIKNAGQDYRMKVHDMIRNVKLTFIWRFNGFKSSDTVPDVSRFGTGK